MTRPDPPGTEGDRAQVALARRGEILTALAFVASVLGALGLSAVYWSGGQPQLEGLFLAIALGGIGVGLVVWARYFLPKVPAVEERHDLASTEEEIDDFRATFEQGEHLLTRRRLLVRTATAAFVALAGAFVFPLRSLGPRPGRGFGSTAFRRGVRLVTDDGEPVRVSDVTRDGVLTVFPEGHVGSADAPTLLLRPDVAMRHRQGREDWTPEGLVAYSKLCTHVGCPVGLYQSEQHLLLCPCHQSTFDVLDGARPVFGPAARSLPQLPLAVDGEGYVIARGDFSGPTGAGFWDRDRRRN